MLQLLAPDVELHSDGGGVQKAPRRTILGQDKVSRFSAGAFKDGGGVPDPELYVADVNGSPALVVTSNGAPFAVLAVQLVDGRIARIDLLANPEKLTGLKDIARRGTKLDLQLW